MFWGIFFKLEKHCIFSWTASCSLIHVLLHRGNMNAKSWQQRGKGKKGGREEGREEEDGLKKIRNWRQTQPTSKSLSNLIGVIESFWLLRHWADVVNTAMKSALTLPRPTHNDVYHHISSYWTLWARWKQMFGLGMREHGNQRAFTLSLRQKRR